MADVKVYGADWCSMTKAALAHLNQIGVEYEYINIDRDRQAAKWVASQNGGREKKPTLNIRGLVLSEPTNAEIDAALTENG
ncbi:MAG: glutaredoxin family protein [Acidobacteriaceae bacterium]|nr:glutaredoxin family protein [Acidobacteriaceae bacterium]